MIFFRYLNTGVDSWLRNIVNEVILSRDVTRERRNDLLQAVLDKREREGNKDYDEDTVVGQALTFLFDGYETSSVVMSYSLYQVKNICLANIIRLE